MKIRLVFMMLVLYLLLSCTSQPEPILIPHRESLIPDSVVKMSPENDPHPPISLSEEFEQPVPLPYPINTRGLEDSAFIMPDGQTLYFVYVPNANMDHVAQSMDLVTGIYVSHFSEGFWSEPDRVWLTEPGMAVLDGCEFVTKETMWFCTAREGYTGIHWFTARNSEDQWSNWRINDFDPDFEVGEFHIYGDRLYYHSDRAGGIGGKDIWMLSLDPDGNWVDPVNVFAVNSERDEGWPVVSPDGRELWISRDYGLWRSYWKDGEWGEPELIITPLAGEATIDAEGNIYFTHHFYDEAGSIMLEADIYIAVRK